MFSTRPLHNKCLLVKHICSSWMKLHSRTLQTSKQVDFGILFDIDGVLARGYVPLPAAQASFRLIQDSNGGLQVPTAFVTNALSLHSFKAHQLSQWLQCKIDGDQMVMAHSPLAALPELHHKHCLVVGQGPLREITQELGFTRISTIDDVASAYAVLDVVDHYKRDCVSQADITSDVDFPPIEAVILLGEPRHWETPLQLLVDILLTNGQPSSPNQRGDQQMLPVIACNLDLQYMHRAPYPRYGHGAFLLCLQSLFKAVTGKEIKYHYVVGKPSEITFRYSEHIISQRARHMGLSGSIQRLYMIGDNQEVDIYGANLYQQYIENKASKDPQPPASRSLPAFSQLQPQSVTNISSILVRTGVFKDTSARTAHHSHRDFPINDRLLQPEIIVDNVYDAMQYILHQEK